MKKILFIHCLLILATGITLAMTQKHALNEKNSIEIHLKEIANKLYKENLVKAALVLNSPDTQNWIISDAAKKWVQDNPEKAEWFLVSAAQLDINVQPHPMEVKIFLDLGVNPNVPHVNRAHITPLNQAIRVGNIDAVRLLLAHGANANFESIGTTPLYFAVNPLLNSKHNRKEIVQLLIDAGAKVNQPIEFERNLTAIEIAETEAKKDPAYQEIVKILKQTK